MGKKIVKATAWSCRPALFLCHKTITFIFALFCVISGLFARTADAQQNITLRGQALSSQDSSVLGNIKLYLCSVAYPVYGTTVTRPYFGVVDSGGGW